MNDAEILYSSRIAHGRPPTWLSDGCQRRAPPAAAPNADDRIAAVPLARTRPSGLSTEAVQGAVRVNVTCVTPLGEEVASTW